MNPINSINPSNSINSNNSSIRYVLVAALALSFFVAYFNTFSRLVKSWASFDEAHTVILLAISLFLLWMKRNNLKQLSAHPAIKSGLFVMLLSCLMLMGGKISGTKLLQDISLPVTIAGITLLIGGKQYIRQTWLPIAYLYFVFGLFDAVLGGISIYLQHAAAYTASSILQLTGMPVVFRGITLQLPHIILEVQRGCSGQKHILALMALATPIAFVRHRGIAALALVCFAFLIGVSANGLRIAIIGLWTVDHPGSVHGPHDIFYVSFILFSGMILFILASWTTKRYWPGSLRRNHLTAIQGSVGNAISGPGQQASTAAYIVGILVLCFTIAILQIWTPHAAVLRQSLATLPETLNEWSGEDLADSKSSLQDTNPDELLIRKYTHHTGTNANLDIAYFETQNEDRKIPSYRTNWLSEGMRIIPLVTDAGTSFIGKTIVKHDTEGPETFYFWFDINGSVTTNLYKARMRTILEIATKRRSNGAIVLVSFPEMQRATDQEQLLFLRQVFPLIRNLLKQTS